MALTSSSSPVTICFFILFVLMSTTAFAIPGKHLIRTLPRMRISLELDNEEIVSPSNSYDKYAF